MTEAPAKRDPIRFRLYYRLMDFCLLFSFLGYIALISVLYAGLDNTKSSILLMVSVILLSNFAVSFFLVFARFMRDDYAEGLWRRSLAIMGYLVAIGPLFVLISAWIIYFIALRISYPEAPLDGTVFLDAPEYIDWLFKPGVVPMELIMWMWQLFLFSYVLIFQFLRWRDR